MLAGLFIALVVTAMAAGAWIEERCRRMEIESDWVEMMEQIASSGNPERYWDGQRWRFTVIGGGGSGAR